MPIQFELATSPGGLRHLLIDVSGWIDVEEGRAIEAQLESGRAHHDGLMLSRIAKGTDYSHEVRRFFPTLSGKYRAAAVVVTSPIARAAINLMIRISGRKGHVGLFDSHEEALAWLEEFARSHPRR